MIEIARRIFLVCGVLGGVTAALWTPSAIVELRSEDPRLWYSRALSRRAPFGATGSAAEILPEGNRPVDFSEFVAQHTSGRLIQVHGDAWRAIFAGMHPDVEAEQQESSDATGTPVRDSSISIFLKCDDETVSQVVRDMRERQTTFSFLVLQTARGPKYASLSIRRPADVRDRSANAVVFPYRSASPWWFAAAALVYAVLPWPRRTTLEALRYERFSAVILPDALATGLMSMFFAMPFLILSSNTTTDEMFDFSDSGWGYLTVVMWSFAAFVASIYAFAAHYAAFEVVIEPDRLLETTWRGTRVIRFADVVSVEPADFRPPRWLRVLSLVGGLMNWRLAGQALLLESRDDFGLMLRFRDGQCQRILFSGLPGWERIVEAFRTAGIPLSTGSAR